MPKIVNTVYHFNDVSIIPQYTELSTTNINTTTNLHGLQINLPIIFNYEKEINDINFAIEVTQNGAISCIAEMDSIDEQVKVLQKIKKHTSWIIENPVTQHKDTSADKVLEIMKKENISGIPIIDDDKQLCGIVTIRDLRLSENLSIPISNFMTTNNLITASPDIKPKDALLEMHNNKIEKLPIVNDKLELVGLITIKDVQNFEKFPYASKDKNAKLQAFAKVTVNPNSIKRIMALCDNKIDGITLHSNHGHSGEMISTIKTIKSLYPDLIIIAGNILTVNGAEDLIKAGANCVKVGPNKEIEIGTGVGMPSFSAIYNISETCKRKKIPLIADCNINNSSNMIKAIAAGADAIITNSKIMSNVVNNITKNIRKDKLNHETIEEALTETRRRLMLAMKYTASTTMEEMRNKNSFVVNKNYNHKCSTSCKYN